MPEVSKERVDKFKDWKESKFDAFRLDKHTDSGVSLRAPRRMKDGTKGEKYEC